MRKFGVCSKFDDIHPPLAPADVVAGYRIVSMLGQGGVARVYEAVAPGSGRRVALKVIRQDGGLDSELRRRFLREARLASQLRHPHIVRVLEVIDAEGISAIAMDLVDGEPLHEVIPKTGMAIDRALRAGIEICAALGEAHARGIVHRDLKPGNVMIDGAGSVRVLDFGAAKHLLQDRTAGGGVTSTAVGLVIGTPVYMSPEQALGERVDFRSDIFSFGSVLYEMVTGRAPFKRRSVLATLSAIVREPVRPIRELRVDVPEAIDAVIAKCLSKDMAGRFETIGAAGAVLEVIARRRRAARPI